MFTGRLGGVCGVLGMLGEGGVEEREREGGRRRENKYLPI
jgi:hypothetical protein